MTTDDELGAAVSRAQALAVAGDRAGARACYAAMWADAERGGDAYQACVAAHFMAHEHDDPAAQLTWHRRALHAAEQAEAAGDTRVSRFYPSLHANLADVYLRLGHHNQARQHVERARAVEAALPDDGYGQMIRRLIARLATEVPPAR